MKKTIVNIIVIAGLLACSCASKKETLDMNNPFFQVWETPYQVPPFAKIKTEHYIPAFEEGMKQHVSEVEAIINQKEAPTFANTIAALDYSGTLINTVSAVFFNLLETNSTDEMQKIAEEISPKLSAHGDNINLNPELFQRVKTVYENKDKENLNKEQLRLLDETYKDFVRGGANLTQDKQKRFREINEEISILTLQFNKNVLNATNAYQLIIDKEDDLAGLPESIITAAAELGNQKEETKGKWVFTLNNPSLLPFLQYADNRAKREEIWNAYSSRCNGGQYDNNSIIKKLVQLRVERAQLLGYKTHADFVLDDNMAKTPQAVYELLMQVWHPALAKAKEESALYQKEAGKEKLMPWDWRYYTEKIRKKHYDLNEDSLRPYFSLSNVQEGAYMVANKLYGLTFKQNKDIPVYDKDVVVYEVFDKDKVIGILYLDYYTRPSKSSGAWMTEFRSQYQTQNGENVIPVISLVFNFPNPTEKAPSLLNFDETETFFHEFGHGLHGLLSKCQYRSIAGTNVPRDFVELPSQVMENWASHSEVMKMYAKHNITGEVIPQKWIDKIEKAGTYGQGFINAELIAASLLDMDYHTLTDATDLDPTAFEQQTMEKYGLIPEIISRYKSPYFKHIFTSAMGYSSGYYSYTWSAVLDADAFEAFKENGLFDQKTAQSFRTNILERGNTDDPMTLYINFRGKSPSIDPLLQNRGLK
ncbi:MAG: M3 family metallopeptidase [Bacteroidales bacterium]|jgi:peptidyl-dipeptidase Dcp|nr:M3 family metallopeptidase [Bacteroidales bacterium]